MSATRSFDYDYLKRLVAEHPDWSHHEYARAVTDEARTRLRDPGLPPVLPNTVAAALSRYRDTWLAQGVAVPPRKGGTHILPWANIPMAYAMNTPLRRLRMLHRIAMGERDLDPREVRLTHQFARKLRESRHVIDLSPRGEPYERPARPDELDGTGQLLDFYARYPGLTGKMWAELAPDERRIASMRWMAPHMSAVPSLNSVLPVSPEVEPDPGDEVEQAIWGRELPDVAKQSLILAYRTARDGGGYAEDPRQTGS